MGRIVMAIITISIIGFIAYKQLYGRSALSTSSEPKQKLENVQKAANRIEDQQQKAADKAFEEGQKAEGN
jgi:hypothetical protein